MEFCLFGTLLSFPKPLVKESREGKYFYAPKKSIHLSSLTTQSTNPLKFFFLYNPIEKLPAYFYIISVMNIAISTIHSYARGKGFFPLYNFKKRKLCIFKVGDFCLDIHDSKSFNSYKTRSKPQPLTS